MDYLYIILFLLVLLAGLYGLSRMDARTKKKYKHDAYKLLETANADIKKVRDTIKGLRLYGGRFKKDKECYQLIQKLQDKLEASG